MHEEPPRTVTLTREETDQEAGALMAGRTSMAAVKRIAVSRDGSAWAYISHGGVLRVFREDKAIGLDVRPPAKGKEHSDRGMQTLAFGPKDETLVVATATDVASFNAHTGEPLWEYVPKRMFALLRSIPLDMAVADVDSQEFVVVSMSSGEMTVLDNAGKLVQRLNDNDAPQSMVAVGMTLFGTDGYSLTVWQLPDLQKTDEVMKGERIYRLTAASDDGLLVRTDKGVSHVGLDGEVHRTFTVSPGVPTLAFCSGSRTFVTVSDNELFATSIDTGEVVARTLCDYRPSAVTCRNGVVLVGTKEGHILAYQEATLEFLTMEIEARPNERAYA